MGDKFQCPVWLKVGPNSCFPGFTTLCKPLATLLKSIFAMSCKSFLNVDKLFLEYNENARNYKSQNNVQKIQVLTTWFQIFSNQNSVVLTDDRHRDRWNRTELRKGFTQILFIFFRNTMSVQWIVLSSTNGAKNNQITIFKKKKRILTYTCIYTLY